MPDRPVTDQPEVSARIHYMIKKGRIPLPAKEHAQIIRCKFELQAVLRLIVRIYVSALAGGRLREAEDLLCLFRAANDPEFVSIFERHGYPDEMEPDEETVYWLALAKVFGDELLMPEGACKAIRRFLAGNGVTEQDIAGERKSRADDSRLTTWQPSEVEIRQWKEAFKLS